MNHIELRRARALMVLSGLGRSLSLGEVLSQRRNNRAPRSWLHRVHLAQQAIGDAFQVLVGDARGSRQ